MSFAKVLNEYVILLVTLLATLLLIGFRLAFRKGEAKKHIPYLFILSVYIVYLLISPFYFFTEEIKLIIGTDISDYYGLSFWYSCITVFSFIVGYWVTRGKGFQKWDDPAPLIPKEKLEKYITLLFYVFYGIVMLNLAIGGVNIQNLFAGNEVVGQGASGASYYLQNFTDSLITIIVLGYLVGIPNRKLLVWIGLSFFLFSVLGFRYRIILSLIGFLLAFLYKHEVRMRQVAIAVTLGSLFLYIIIFSTLNRNALMVRNYDRIIYDPLEFEMEGFFIQTRGELADMAIYKLYDDPNKNVSHDYGLTMFGYIFIRMIPRFIYEDKDSFYPPPQLAIQTAAYFAWWGRQSGEAILSNGAIFIAWGMYGLVFANFFWGVLLKKFASTIRRNDPLSLIIYLVIALAFFQWITRGYFPQTVDHFFYLMFPVWALKYLRTKHKHATD